jgi:hypothetical protein
MAGGINPNTCPSAPGVNHPAASVVIKANGPSRPGSQNALPPMVGAQATGPTWIGIGESRAVRVSRGHVDDAGCQ